VATRPRLLPRLVIAIDADRRAHAFRVGFRADGSLTVTRSDSFAAPAPTRRYILAFDPALGFFRNAQTIPRSGAELSAMAADMFPFDPATVRYCASAGAEGRVLYHAMPQADLDALLGAWPAPVALIAATADPQSVLAALTARIDRGAVADLLPDPYRLLPPAAVLAGALGSLAAGVIVAALLVWNLLLTAEQRELRRESARIEAEAAPILKQRDAILRMASAIKEHAAFARLPSGRAFEILTQLVAKIPDGTAIETIEINGDNLSVSGIGANAQAWLASAGLPAAAVKEEAVLKLTRFQATIPLKDDVDATPSASKDTKKP